MTTARCERNGYEPVRRVIKSRLPGAAVRAALLPAAWTADGSSSSSQPASPGRRWGTAPVELVTATGQPRLDAPAARPRSVPRARPTWSPVAAAHGSGERVCPGTGTSLALTIDDGTNTEVVAAFAALAADTGIRLTFFPNGCYRSWEDNAAALRPLVDSGQVALGNHTWSHPDLTTLGDSATSPRRSAATGSSCGRTFGVQDSPFFRPPFGPATSGSTGSPPTWGTRPSSCGTGPSGTRRLPAGELRGRGPEVVHRAADRRRAREPRPVTTV